MRPIKITIQGSYLDCQIYRGWLYLWSFDGKLSVYDWPRLVDSLVYDQIDEIAFKFSFKDGNYLYKQSLKEIFCDNDFMSLLKQKFQRIEPYKLHVSEHHLRQFLVGEMDTPSSSLPIDTEIYNNNLYYTTDNGLFKANAHKTEGNPVSSKPIKLWDARILSIKANKYPQLAISAGDDGLFEFSMSREGDFFENLRIVEDNIHQICESHSSFANYINMSIYSSSLIGKAYLAFFNWKGIENNNYFEGKRDYFETFDSSYIFGDESDSLSWGVDGKIFRVNKRGFNIIAFHNGMKDQRFVKKDDFKKSLDRGHVIGGASAYFGNIVEFENGLSVIQTDGQRLSINQPVTRWRIYPRSINYENQLHVLLDDHMDIYAFNHDYFISQHDKELGIDYLDVENRRSFRR